MLCDLRDSLRCPRCRKAAAGSGVLRECVRPGLGDRIASCLQAVGITKERVSAAIGRDCGCQHRQQLANRWGRLVGFGD